MSGIAAEKKAPAAFAEAADDRRSCGISIDVDSVSSHLQGYGIDDAPDRDEHLHIAIPRAIELFSRLGVRATFFLIAEEAVRAPEIVRAIVQSGHEVASHSMTHRVPFLADPEEIFDSKLKLEELSGGPIAGFRAPSWDFEPEMYVRLGQAGYRYDASAFPSWMLLLYRLSVRKRAVGSGKQVGMPPWRKMFGRASPYRLPIGWIHLFEFPVSTAFLIRIPWYHTLNYLLPPAIFSVVQWLTLARRTPVQYVFHAVDFLGLTEDNIDTRLQHHPGMNLPLAEKLERITALLKSVSAKRKLVSLVEIVDKLKR